MAVPMAFLPHRFRSAVAHYVAGRPPYPSRLIERVAALTGLPRTGRVLDLGCGPGQLAVAFAAYAAEVLAVDPEPEMLRAARAAAGAAPIRFLQGSSYDLGPPFGQIDLTVMGRSFHWMDRAETLRRLDRLIVPGGAVVLFGDTNPELPDNAWRPAWREAVARYRDASYERPHRGADWIRHEALLFDSAFCRLDSVAAIDRRRIPVAALVDRALSRSGSTPARLGDRVAALSEEVVAVLAPFAQDGMITEVVETYALIATREDAA
jgi:SAM-dependent methyltransferase